MTAVRGTDRCASRGLGLLASLAAAIAPAGAGTLSDELRIDSQVLGYAVQYRIYLPDAPPGQPLPTLYVTDGPWYLGEGHMKQLLDELIAAGRIEPLVAVFVDPNDPDRPKINRRSGQLTCSSDYARFFATELVPAVDAAYPTRREPASRTILGLSFGGLNAACFGLRLPHVFTNIAMQSPASGEMVDAVGKAYLREERLPLRVFLSVGTRQDNTDAGRRLRHILEDKGYPLTYVEVPHGHNWNNWGPLLPEVLVTFYGRP